MLEQRNKAEFKRVTREFCRSSCFTSTFNACTSLDQSFQVIVDQAEQSTKILLGIKYYYVNVAYSWPFSDQFVKMAYHLSDQH